MRCNYLINWVMKYFMVLKLDFNLFGLYFDMGLYIVY